MFLLVFKKYVISWLKFKNKMNNSFCYTSLKSIIVYWQNLRNLYHPLNCSLWPITKAFLGSPVFCFVTVTHWGQSIFELGSFSQSGISKQPSRVVPSTSRASSDLRISCLKKNLYFYNIWSYLNITYKNMLNLHFFFKACEKNK